MAPARRDFLGWLGKASIAGAALLPARLQASAAPRARDVDAHPMPISDAWDMSWTARVTGQHRAVFDSPEMSDGAAMYRAVSWLDQYEEVYGAARNTMTAVVVLRHQGFLMAMNDAFWERFEVGKERKIRDREGKKWARTNIVGPAAAAADPANAKFSIPNFIADGGIVLACGWTFQGAAQRFVKADGLTREAAAARAKEHLLPGVILQPNGIFAALRAQEAGCAYIDAS